MVSSAYLRLLIFPGNLDSSLCFLQPSVSHDVIMGNKRLEIKMSKIVTDYFGVGVTSTAFFGLLCISPFMYSAITFFVCF